MFIKEEIPQVIYDIQHRSDVLSVIRATLPRYFETFSHPSLAGNLLKGIADFEKELPAYQKYLDQDLLNEYEEDAAAFKAHTKNKCTVIHKTLQSTADVMKTYKASFVSTTGRKLLDCVQTLVKFSSNYEATFSHSSHENITDPDQFALDNLDLVPHYVPGVIGYGIQSTLLYMLEPYAFAHRVQDAMWSLYFLSDKQSFGLEGGSEFLLFYPEIGKGEQNFNYPPKLFAFYSLQIYKLLKAECEKRRITLDPQYRYTYLEAFQRHVAEQNRSSINFLRQTSDSVEGSWYG